MLISMCWWWWSGETEEGFESLCSSSPLKPKNSKALLPESTAVTVKTSQNQKDVSNQELKFKIIYNPLNPFRIWHQYTLIRRGFEEPFNQLSVNKAIINSQNMKLSLGSQSSQSSHHSSAGDASSQEKKQEERILKPRKQPQGDDEKGGKVEDF